MSVSDPERGSGAAAGWAGCALTGVAAFLFASVKVLDPDTWWHLATGRWIFAHGLPETNTFSFTYPDHPWKHVEWLFDVLLAAAERVGGLLAVEGVQIALVVLAFLLACDTIRREHGGRLPAVYYPAALLALAVSWHRFTPRPHLVTFVGLAALLNLHRRQSRLLPLWFALVALAWGNAHGGVVFGAAVVALIPLAAVLEGDLPRARRALGPAAAFLAGSVCTPHLWQPYRDALFHLDVRSVVRIAEFGPVDPRVQTAFVVFALIAVAAVPHHLRQRRFLHLLLVVAFLPLALRAVRVTPKFALVALPGTVAALAAWAQSLRRDAGPRAPAALVCLLGLVAAGGVVREMREGFPPNAFGWGVNHAGLPEGASRFLEQAPVSGNLYNDFGQGGYLIWRFFPQRRVFQDGRAPYYPPEFQRGIRDLYRAGDVAAWGALMDRHRVEGALVDRMPYRNGLDAGVMFARLGWTLVYVDGLSYVYVRPGAANGAVAERHGFRHLGYRESPQRLFEVGRESPAGLRAELRRLDPGGLILAEDFARFAAGAIGAGDAGLARGFLAAGLARHPRDAGLRDLAARLTGAGG